MFNLICVSKFIHIYAVLCVEWIVHNSVFPNIYLLLFFCCSNSGWSRCACGFCDNAAVSQSAFVVLTMQSFSGDNHQNTASLNGNNSSSVGWSHGGYSHQHPAHPDQTVAQKYQPSVYTEPQVGYDFEL